MASHEKEQRIVRFLYGRDATELNVVRVVQGRRSAAAMSRGGAKKRYGSSTTNEDAVLLVEGPIGALVAVADAHSGPQGSELALGWLAEQRALEWVASGVSPGHWSGECTDVFLRINECIRIRNAEEGSSSRTTLSIALLDVAQRIVLAASAGDSQVFLCGPDEARRIANGAGAGSFFLGVKSGSRREIADACGVATVRACGERALVVASDGLLTDGVGFANPDAAIQESVMDVRAGESPGESARSLAAALVRRGCAAQDANLSGDDIAVGVAWIGDSYDPDRGQMEMRG